MEYWDLYDPKGQFTGERVAKGDPLPKDRYHLAVEVWVVNRKGELLIQRRSDSVAILPGVWAHTTGRVCAGETPLMGCIRELEEELGVRANPKEVVHIKRILREDGTQLIWDVYCLLKNISVEEIKRQEEEVAEIKWVTRAEFRRMLQAGVLYRYPEIEEILERVMCHVGGELCLPEKRGTSV